MLTGENGILTQAQNAKEETEKAQDEEIEILDNYENYINDITGDVSQVNDTNPGVLEGSGTGQDPFIINSIEDLVVFADNVTKGINNYGGQYVELGISLDFNSDKSYVNPNREDYAQYGYNGKLKEVLNTSGFIPIGKIEYNIENNEQFFFSGNFNGNNCKIYNLRIEDNINSDLNIFIGLFSANYGVIKEIGLENISFSLEINTSQYANVGALVGNNFGNIEKSYSEGNMQCTTMQYSTNIGGLTGSNSGTIKECFNNVDILGINKGSYQIRVGGIVAANESNSNLKDSYNLGDIQGKVQGITCSALIGGISGVNFGRIENAYTIGMISNIEGTDNIIGIGSLVGTNKSEIVNCYYLENTIDAYGINTNIIECGELKTIAQMKNQKFLDLLNKDNRTWKFSNGKNNGYPILNWQ